MSTRNIYDILNERGYLAQSTNHEKVRELLGDTANPVRFYCGFDPTADSLHVGHFIILMICAHLQRAGHFPILLMGGGTGLIGDPSGRSDLRKVLTEENVIHNVQKIQEQLSLVMDLSAEKSLVVNNADWLRNLNYIELLRDVGSSFSVNRMLAAECYKSRYEKGLTFLEFNYMIMQSYDFYYLFKNHNCTLEVGGDDQWSNILAGADLIRRKEGKEAHALTFSLLTNFEGKKMGKSANGTIWLSAEKCSVFDFYQYFRNVHDQDVIKLLKLLTFLPMEEIAEYAKLEGQAINEAKKRLALEVTTLVHGKENALQAAGQASSLFEAGNSSEYMPTTDIAADSLDTLPTLLDLLVDLKFIPSKGEGRRLISQGGLSINNQKVSDIAYKLSLADFQDTNEVIVKKGKKHFYRLLLK